MANCVEVEQAITATQMDLGQDLSGHGPAEALMCASEGQPIVDIFADGFERGISKWQRTNTTYWETIPSASFPVRYASQGRASLNGWANTSHP